MRVLLEVLLFLFLVFGCSCLYINKTCVFVLVQISEEEGRVKKDEEETKEMWKRKREHEEQWEGTREKRVRLSYFITFYIFSFHYKYALQCEFVLPNPQTSGQ